LAAYTALPLSIEALVVVVVELTGFLTEVFNLTFVCADTKPGRIKSVQRDKKNSFMTDYEKLFT
jgi:hypothetical protein